MKKLLIILLILGVVSVLIVNLQEDNKPIKTKQQKKKDVIFLKDSTWCQVLFIDSNTATISTKKRIDKTLYQIVADSFQISKSVMIYFHVTKLTDHHEAYGTLYDNYADEYLHFNMDSLILEREKNEPNSPANNRRTSILDKDFARIAFVISKTFVERNLKSPKSADFPFSDYSFSNVKDNTITIKSYVDAKNALGTETRNNYVIVLKLVGSEPMDAAQWRMLSLDFN